MSAEDEDSGDSVVEITDEEDNCFGPSSPSVVGSAEEASSSEDEEDWERSVGFLDDVCGEQHGHPTNQIIRGKCLLCTNLDNDIDLDARCQVPSAEPWCKCGHCKIVSYHMKKYDRICCRELSQVVAFLDEELDSDCQDICITQHPRFKADVLEYGALFRSTQPRLDRYKIKHGKDGKERAHHSAWSFVKWIWDRMGYNTRIMPPACVIAKIRQEHMKSAPFWYYRSFVPGKKICEYGRHCVAATKDTFSK